MEYWKAALLITLLSVTPSFTASGKNLSAEDVAAIQRVHHRYEASWLKGDADGVRSLFTEDSVLLPPHGDQPRVGKKQLDDFWFPPVVPLATVTKLVLSIENIGGDGLIAYAWGTYEVGWQTVKNGKATTSNNKGTFLNILRKQPDGEWRISHHMWDATIPQH